MRAVKISEPNEIRNEYESKRYAPANVIVQLVHAGDVGVIDLSPVEGEMTTPFERFDDENARDAPQEVVAPQSQIAGAGFAQGTRIGKYEVVEKLGQGSFGVVLTARDTELDREVALKILNPSHHDDPEVLQRFLVEARAAARVKHPCIITVLECGRHTLDDEELAYIAMEKLDGESLGSRLARLGTLTPGVAMEIARQVASALAAAHAADVLHRDLKPENIFLVPDPASASGERVKVLDFGLAKLASSNVTQVTSVFGTPLYMSPEQCRSSGKIDQRSDIYALGCILYELVTGRTPFEGELYKIVERHQKTIAPRARELVPSTPRALDDLIAQMLAKDPGARPPTMAAVQRRLQLAGALVPGSSEPVAKQDPEPVRDESVILLDRIKREPGPLAVAPVTFRARPRQNAIAALAAITIAVALAAILSLAANRHDVASKASPALKSG
jgi:serine/threonine protein kinase